MDHGEGPDNNYPGYAEGSSDDYFNYNFYTNYHAQVAEQDATDEDFNNTVEEYRRYRQNVVVQNNHVHGGSVEGRRYKARTREEKFEALKRDYFVERPVFSDEDFRRRFRMKKPLFMRLVADCERVNPYFRQKRDNIGRLGFTALHKVTVAMRMLAYSFPADAIDDQFHMAETTACETMQEFCKTILEVHKPNYLRAPTNEDLKKLLWRAEQRGFPGMVGSLDCMHWDWKNCPTAWQGSFSGKSKKPTIVLEAVASADTWIWHAFFGVPGAQNDITVLGRSPLFNELETGKAPQIAYKVNNNEHYMTYYLADGIYPKWATLVQAIRNPRKRKEKLFTQMQESYRKDVERAFGILQARFAIIKQPGRGWHIRDLGNIMLTCVILHNMIVEDERDEYADKDSDDDDNNLYSSRRARANIYPQYSNDINFEPRTGNISLDEYMMRRCHIRSVDANQKLRDDLVEHVWNTRGEN